MKQRIVFLLTLLVFMTGCSQLRIEKRRYFSGFYMSHKGKTEQHANANNKGRNTIEEIPAGSFSIETRIQKQDITVQDQQPSFSTTENMLPRAAEHLTAEQHAVAPAGSFKVNENIQGRRNPEWNKGLLIAMLVLFCLVYTPGMFILSTLMLEGLSKDGSKPKHKWAKLCEILYYPAIAAFIAGIVFLILSNFSMAILLDVSIFCIGLLCFFISLIILFAEKSKAQSGNS